MFTEEEHLPFRRVVITKEENDARVRELEELERKGIISRKEELELKARKETGDPMITELEARKAAGERLPPAEEIELENRKRGIARSKGIQYP